MIQAIVLLDYANIYSLGRSPAGQTGQEQPSGATPSLDVIAAAIRGFENTLPLDHTLLSDRESFPELSAPIAVKVATLVGGNNMTVTPHSLIQDLLKAFCDPSCLDVSLRLQ